MTLAEKILTAPVVQSGEKFRAAGLAKYLGERRHSVSFALNQLRTDGLVDITNTGEWFGRRKHWINMARLNDAKGLRRARV